MAGAPNAAGRGAHPRPVRRRWLRALGAIAIAPAATAAALLIPFPHSTFVVRLLLVALVQVVLAVLLRRPAARSRPVNVMLGSYLLLLWLASALIILGRLTSRFLFVNRDLEPADVLITVFVGIVVLCIPAILVVSWAEAAPLIEPVLFGSIAVIIGGLCLPAMAQLTQSDTAVPAGDVALFVSSKSTRFELSNEVMLPPLSSIRYGSSTLENIGINSPDRQPFHWALLLTGNARLTDADPDFHAGTVMELGNRGRPGYEELSFPR
jgi:hypothetical protein